MYPSKIPVASIVHMIVVLIVVMTTLIMTSNPLALFGLYFMPQIQLVPSPEDTAPDPDEEPYQTSAIGFHTNPDPDDE